MTEKPSLDDIGTIEPAYPLQPLRQVSAGILGHASGYRLLVEGPLTAGAIRTLIRHLEITREAMKIS